MSGAQRSPRLVGSVSVADLNLRAGSSGPASLIDADLMAVPPTLTWGSGFNVALDGSDVAAKIAANSTLPSAKLVGWADPRVKAVGAIPVAWTSSGYGQLFATAPEWLRNGNLYRDTNALNGAPVCQHTIDIVTQGGAFACWFYGASNSRYRVLVDGQPHAAAMATVTPTDGKTYLLRVEGLAPGQHTIALESVFALFGGFVLAGVDQALAPRDVGGPLCLVLGDSYSIAANPTSTSIIPADTFGLRYARRRGYSRVVVAGFGGTGVLCNGDYSAGNTGPNYLERLELIKGLIPLAEVGEVLIQGSTNDGAHCTQTQPLKDALAAQTQSLVSRVRQLCPNAKITFTSTLRVKTPIQSDRDASAVFKAQCALRTDVTYVDQVGEAWFTGTGNADTTSPSSVGIQSDDSHPTPIGQGWIGDYTAARAAAAEGGQVYRRDRVRRPLVSRASAAVVSGATLVADPQLALAVQPYDVKDFLAVIRCDSTSTENFVFDFTAPSGCEMYWGVPADGALDYALGDSHFVPGQGAGTVVTTVVRGVVVNGATAGVVQARFAKNTLVVTNMFDNPDFETDTSNLVVQNNAESAAPTLSSSTDTFTSWPPSGTHSAKLTGTITVPLNGSGYIGVRARDAGATRFAATAGQPYLLSCDAYVSDPPASDNNGFYATIDWYNGATFLSRVTTPLHNYATGLQSLTLAAVAPAGTTAAECYIFGQSGTDADTVTFYLDKLVFGQLLATNVQPTTLMAFAPYGGTA